MEPILLATGIVVPAALGAWWGGALLPTRGMHDLLSGGVTWRARAGTVALTFDDGPHPRSTPALLDLLSEHRAVATFFVVGQLAARHPELIAEIAGRGHAIGNHTWSHLTLPRLGRARIAAELDRCQDAVAAVTGVAPRLVRPPYGRRDVRVYRVARERGLVPVMWSLDGRDWLRPTEAGVSRRLARAKARDVILLHDGRDDVRPTLGALRRLLPRLAAAGIATSVPTPGATSSPWSSPRTNLHP